MQIRRSLFILFSRSFFLYSEHQVKDPSNRPNELIARCASTKSDLAKALENDLAHSLRNAINDVMLRDLDSSQLHKGAQKYTNFFLLLPGQKQETAVDLVAGLPRIPRTAYMDYSFIFRAGDRDPLLLTPGGGWGFVLGPWISPPSVLVSRGRAENFGNSTGLVRSFCRRLYLRANGLAGLRGANRVICWCQSDLGTVAP